MGAAERRAAFLQEIEDEERLRLKQAQYHEEMEDLISSAEDPARRADLESEKFRMDPARLEAVDLPPLPEADA